LGEAPGDQHDDPLVTDVAKDRERAFLHLTGTQEVPFVRRDAAKPAQPRCDQSDRTLRSSCRLRVFEQHTGGIIVPLVALSETAKGRDEPRFNWHLQLLVQTL